MEENLQCTLRVELRSASKLAMERRGRTTYELLSNLCERSINEIKSDNEIFIDVYKRLKTIFIESKFIAKYSDSDDIKKSSYELNKNVLTNIELIKEILRDNI